MLKSKKYIAVYGAVCAALVVFIGVNTVKFVHDGHFDAYLYIMSYLLAASVWVVGAVDFRLAEKPKRLISVILPCIVPFLDMQFSLIFAGRPEFSLSIYFINVLFYFCLSAVVFSISASGKASGIVSALIAYVFNLASFVVKITRGTPLVPGDILAVGTAAQVAGNYSFHVTYEFVEATVLLVFVIALFVNFEEDLGLKGRKRAIASSVSAGAAVLFAAVMMNVNVRDMNIDMFDQIHANNTHGVAYGFFINWRKMKLTKPADYSEEYVKNVLLSGKDERDAPEDMPNIIVIMNESFSDLAVNGALETDIGYMDNFYSLSENTIRGQMLVTPYGGGTCNTEYEFLTGMSMGTLPPGSMPYLQYIQRDYPMSLVKHLSQMGYKTAAFHPYAGKDWNRYKVYGCLGFDDFVSEENMDEYLSPQDFRYVRNYLSDETDYDILLNMLADKDEDERMFIFNVTIQNHGGYNFEDEEEEYEKVHITNLKGIYPEAEQYLSIMRESDRVFGDFIGKIQGLDEPAIVVMFGDHQPGLEEAFYAELYGLAPENVTIEELQKRYLVPFVIWANYDIEENTGVFTSPPYLSNYALDAAGLPYSGVNMFLSEEKKDIPAINDMGHYDSDGVWQVNDINTSEALKNYGYVQYYMLNKNNS